MSEGQTTSQKITPRGKPVKTKDTSRNNQRIDEQSKNRNYPRVHAIMVVYKIGQQIVSTRTKLVTSGVKLATKQHAEGTKEITESDKKGLILNQKRIDETIPTGVSYNGEPKYTFNWLTGRNHVYQENKICIRQINPETI